MAISPRSVVAAISDNDESSCLEFSISFRLCLSLVAALVLCAPCMQPAMAQETEADEEEVIEQIIVTGSRIKRDTTFTSTSPLAVIDGSQSLQLGAVDAASMLRQSTSVTGQQIDASFNGFVVDGGPGAQTLALRGLGPERTLVLMDGRRIGAAGNFGGSVFVDLALIPSFLVNRAEILLSGASSIYGADAVAGVVNIITPQNFEGVQLDLLYGSPGDGRGEENVASVQFGTSTDRARFFVGAEYFERDGVRAEDRSFTEGGHRDIFVDDDGELQLVPDGFFDQTIAFGPDCIFAGYTPGQMSGGSTVPNFSCDVDFAVQPYNNWLGNQKTHIFAPVTKWSGFANVEYDLESFGDTTAFVQFLISNRKSSINNGDAQFFPLVPATNAFNPFGTGVVPVAFDRNVRSDVDDTDVLYQRFVGGFKGDVPGLDNMGLSNWTYEVSLGYTRAEGSNQFDIVRNDRLANSLNNCPNSAQDLFGGFSPECVPVNLFSDAFLTRGDLGDAADYLIARVLNNTTIDQTAFEIGFTGDTFDLPAGPVGLFVGASYREDSINSNVDRHLEESNAWGRSSEGDTIGTTDINEIYTEVDVPLLADMTLAKSVGINASYRLSDDKFFGSEDTWRVTAHWDFTDSFRLRGTAGTSFRAPNLKELFIADQTGFTNAFIDPCIPPPSNDERSQTIIDNCVSQGVDPFTLGADGAPSVPTVSGGADDLRPETSDSWSVGAVFAQPWFDGFDFQLSIDLTEIEITDAVAEPSAGFILNECYTSPNLSDPLCARVTRNLAAQPDSRFLLEVDESVANIEVENFKDLSFSTLLSKDFTAGENDLNFTWNADFTRLLDLEEGLFVETADDLVGAVDAPKWQIQSIETLTFGNWSVLHRGFYRSSGRDTEMQLADQGSLDGDVTSISSFHTHSFSVSYQGDTWRAFLTVENAFDAEPDLVDDVAFNGNSINNLPLGVYPSEAIMGRTVIFSVQKTL
jgi:iron complex outermembrane recepter protein